MTNNITSTPQYTAPRQIQELEGFTFNDKAIRALTDTGTSWAGRLLNTIGGLLHLSNNEQKITEKNNEIVKGFFDSITEQYGRDSAMQSSMQLINSHQGRLITIADIRDANKELQNKAETVRNNPAVQQFMPEGAQFKELCQKFPVADNMAFARNLIRQLVHLPQAELTDETIASRAEYVANQTLRDSNKIGQGSFDLPSTRDQLAANGASVQANVIHTQSGASVIGQKLAVNSFEKFGEDISQMQANPALRNHGDHLELKIPANQVQHAYQLLLPLISADQSPIGQWRLTNGFNDNSKLILSPVSENPESKGHAMDLGKFIAQSQRVLENAGITPETSDQFRIGSGYFSLEIEGIDENEIATNAQSYSISRAISDYEKIGNLQGVLRELSNRSGGDVFSASNRAGNQWVDYNNKLMIADGEPIADIILSGVQTEIARPDDIEKSILCRDILGGAKVTLNDGKTTINFHQNHGKLHIETISRDENNRPFGSIKSVQVKDRTEVMALLQEEGSKVGLDAQSIFNLSKCTHQGSVAFGMMHTYNSGFDQNGTFRDHYDDHSLEVTFNISRASDGSLKKVDAIAASVVEVKGLNYVPFEKLPVGYLNTEGQHNISNAHIGNFGIISIISNVGFEADSNGEISAASDIAVNAAMVDINARMNRLQFEKAI